MQSFFQFPQSLLAAITKLVEPTYYHEAAKDARWRCAMGEEICALEENQTWTIEDLLLGRSRSTVSGL